MYISLILMQFQSLKVCQNFGGEANEHWSLMFGSAVWLIWLQRNKLVFGEDDDSGHNIMESVF